MWPCCALRSLIAPLRDHSMRYVYRWYWHSERRTDISGIPYHTIPYGRHARTPRSFGFGHDNLWLLNHYHRSRGVPGVSCSRILGTPEPLSRHAGIGITIETQAPRPTTAQENQNQTSPTRCSQPENRRKQEKKVSRALNCTLP